MKADEDVRTARTQERPQPASARRAVLLIPLKLVRDQPLQQQLFDQLRELITSARLQPGARMPSSRMLAEQFAISRITVLLTYERLIAEGCLETLPAKGTFVVARPPCRAGVPAAAPATPVRLHPLSATPVGRPDASLFPASRWRALMRGALDRLGGQLADESPGGHPVLRAAIAGWLSTSRGLAVTADQIVLVSGRQQALDLAAHLLLRPGGRAVVEDPCDASTEAAFTSMGAELVRIPVDRDGLSTDLLPEGQVALAHVTPEHQRPLGVMLALHRRTALLEWAARAGATVLEEDCEGELRYDRMDTPTLMSLDRGERVILTGGFCTSLGPWLTHGYMVVPQPLVAPALAARRLIDDSSHWLEDTALAGFLESGAYARHVHRLHKVYVARRDALTGALHRHFDAMAGIWGCGAGLHLAWRLPRVLGPAAALAAMARRCGLDAAALPPDNQAGQVLLLGYGALSERQIEAGIAKLAALAGSGRADDALSAD